MEIDSLLASLPPFLFQSLLFFVFSPSLPTYQCKTPFQGHSMYNRSTCMCLEKGAGASSPTAGEYIFGSPAFLRKMLGCRNHFMPCMFPDINQEDCQQVIALLRDCGSRATVNTACIYFQVIVCGEKSKVNERSLQLRGVHLQFRVLMCFQKVAELARSSDGPSGQSPSASETCFLTDNVEMAGCWLP